MQGAHAESTTHLIESCWKVGQGNEKYTYWQWTNYMTTEDSLLTQDRHGTEWLRNLIQKEENVEQRSKSRI